MIPGGMLQGWRQVANFVRDQNIECRAAGIGRWRRGRENAEVIHEGFAQRHSCAPTPPARRLPAVVEDLPLLIVKILDTVQVSFREHKIAPEPFLLIGLITTIRRVLIVTAEFGEVRQDDSMLKYFLIEIAALAAMIMVLVAAAVLLRRLGAPIVVKRAPAV